jgi:hypothetical protein
MHQISVAEKLGFSWFTAAAGRSFEELKCVRIYILNEQGWYQRPDLVVWLSHLLNMNVRRRSWVRVSTPRALKIRNASNAMLRPQSGHPIFGRFFLESETEIDGVFGNCWPPNRGRFPSSRHAKRLPTRLPPCCDLCSLFLRPLLE